jgi:hypothetical protein
MSAGNNIGFVRVMRSHDYNQFEVCLPFNAELGQANPEWVNLLRIDAAKLVDKAVADYDRMKYVMHARDTLSHGDINDHRKDVEDILTVAPERRSPEQKALVTALKNYDHFHGNDYEYDYREDEP